MDALGNELNRLLVGTYRAAGKIEEIMLDDLSGGKLSLSEMRLIECVGSGRRRGRTVTELSQDLDITLPSVTAMVKRLTAKGYLVKQKATEDGRRVIIRLTDAGYLAEYKNTGNRTSGRTPGVLEINGQETGDLFGDGIVISTPIGSTGYSLSAGGPILMDGLEAMLVTPICAHTLHFRPMVCSMDSVVSVTMDGKGVLAADGDRFRSVSRGDRITVTRSGQSTKLMTFRNRNLFRLISEKLT